MIRPGRFANRIARSGSAVHALQTVRETMKSSFVLSLDSDGRATLCRGWRLASFNEGPEIRSSERLAEQLGYSGTWRSDGATATIDLIRDDGICPLVGTYSNLVPRHADRWRLICGLHESGIQDGPNLPPLACRLEGGPLFGEDEPHAVAWGGDRSVILLGEGNGLEITAKYDPTGTAQAEPASVHVAPEPIRERDWESP